MEIEVVLIEATPLALSPSPTVHGSSRRVPFSLEFRGPGESLMEQGTHRFQHRTLGTFELFVVPIGRDDTGIRYEAVFT
jgi:hypothetical protein